MPVFMWIMYFDSTKIIAFFNKTVENSIDMLFSLFVVIIMLIRSRITTGSVRPWIAFVAAFMFPLLNQ